MSYDAKTDWKYNDPVTEDDFNRIEQGIKDAHEMVENQTNDLTAHKNNDTRHITQQERNKWNNKVSQDDFDEAVNDITSQLTQTTQKLDDYLDTVKMLSVATATTQSIPNETSTQINFNSISTAADFAVLDNGQIKIVKSGLYHIELFVVFASNPNGYRRLTLVEVRYSITAYPVTGVPTRLNASRYLNVQNESVLPLAVFQNSGANLDLVEASCLIHKIS